MIAVRKKNEYIIKKKKKNLYGLLIKDLKYYVFWHTTHGVTYHDKLAKTFNNM